MTLSYHHHCFSGIWSIMRNSITHLFCDKLYCKQKRGGKTLRLPDILTADCASYNLCASQVAQMVKNLPAMWENLIQSLGLGRSPGVGNGNPLQCSCLENSMDIKLPMSPLVQQALPHMRSHGSQRSYVFVVSLI